MEEELERVCDMAMRVAVMADALFLQMREAREQEQLNNPHYLKPSDKKSKRHSKPSNGNNLNDIPVAELDLAVPLHVPGEGSSFLLLKFLCNVLFSVGLQSSDKYLQMHRAQEKQRTSSKSTRKLKKKKRKKGQPMSSEDDDDDNVPIVHQVSTNYDLPDGVSLSDQEGGGAGTSEDPHKLLDINLDEPLRDDEILPVRTHRVVHDVPQMLDEQETPAPQDKRHRKHRKRHDSHHKKDKKKVFMLCVIISASNFSNFSYFSLKRKKRRRRSPSVKKLNLLLPLTLWAKEAIMTTV
jgi:AP-3 complex subunit delta-1